MRLGSVWIDRGAAMLVVMVLATSGTSGDAAVPGVPTQAEEPSAWSLRGMAKALNPWPAAERLTRPVRALWPFGGADEATDEPKPTAQPAVANAPLKNDTEQVPLKIASVHYLASLDPERYPEVVEALLASLDDSSEEVRHASLAALRQVLERAAHRCRGTRTDAGKCPSCRREQRAVRRLEQSLLELAADGQLKEDSARNRQLAMALIESFGGAARRPAADGPGERAAAPLTRPEPADAKAGETRAAPPKPPPVKPVAAAPRSSRRMLPGFFKPKFRLPGTSSKGKDEAADESPTALPGKAQASSDSEVEELQFVPLDAGSQPVPPAQPLVVPPRQPAVKQQTGDRRPAAEGDKPARAAEGDDSANRFRPRWSR